MILTFRPIKVWPDGWLDPDRPREIPRFSAPYHSTLDLLDRELDFLGATEVMLQVGASDRDIRLDGQLRADARPGHPGVILTIVTLNHGTLVYSCDRFVSRGRGSSRGTIVDWQANLRAIALGLEGLRRVERYGIADHGEQYAGWKALPSGRDTATSRFQAAEFIQHWAVNDLGVRPWSVIDVLGGCWGDAFKMAARQLHPDRSGGSIVEFQRLVEAKRVLDERP